MPRTQVGQLQCKVAEGDGVSVFGVVARNRWGTTYGINCSLPDAPGNNPNVSKSSWNGQDVRRGYAGKMAGVAAIARRGTGDLTWRRMNENHVHGFATPGAVVTACRFCHT